MARLQTSYTDSTEDEEEQRRILDTLLQLDGPAPESADGPMPDEPTPEPADDESDRELPHWTDPDLSRMELDPAPRRDRGDEGGGVSGEGIANDLSVLAAIIADAAGNKGRGIGRIAATFGSKVASQQAATGARKDRAADREQDHAWRMDELRARQNGVAGKTARDSDFAQWQATDASQRDYESMRLREKGLETGAESLGLRQGIAQAKADLGSDLNQTDIAKAGLKAESSTRAREETKHEYADQVSSDAANRTTATTKARESARLDMVDDINEAAADKVTRQTSARNAANAGKQITPIEQTRLDETRASRDRDLANDFRTKAGDILKVAQATKKLEKIWQDDDVADRKDWTGQRDYHGIGMFDSAKPESSRDPQDQDAATLIGLLRAYEGKDITGAAAGGRDESANINELTGKVKGGSEQQSRAAIKQLSGLTRQILGAQLVGNEDVGRKVLAEYGLDDYAPQKKPSAPGPQMGSDSPQGVGRQATVTSPTGQSRRMPMTPELEAQLTGKGWEVSY